MLACGCATTPRDIQLSPFPFDRICRPPRPAPRPLPPAEVPVDPEAVVALELSPAAQDIAEVIGVMPLLVLLPELERRAAAGETQAEFELLETRQRIGQRISLAELDANTVIAEARCEADRTTRVAVSLEVRRTRSTNGLTLMAVASGAITGAVAGLLTILDERTQGDAVALAGTVVQIGFGAAALIQSFETPLEHRRNLLREVWVGPEETTLFPWTVWQYLSRPGHGGAGAASLRELMISRWRTPGMLEQPGTLAAEHREGLLLGDGGNYTVEDLRARVAMMELLASDVQLMHQDLNLLLRELLARDPPRAVSGE